jgi:hypothetical protein
MSLAPSSHHGDGRCCPSGVASDPNRRGSAEDVNPEATRAPSVPPYGDMEHAISSESCCLRRAEPDVHPRMCNGDNRKRSDARRKEQRQTPGRTREKEWRPEKGKWLFSGARTAHDASC